MKPANVCKHFRTKKLYVPALAEDVFAAARSGSEERDACGHCWCNRTLAEVGSDDKLVNLHACNPSRACFEE